MMLWCSILTVSLWFSEVSPFLILESLSISHPPPPPPALPMFVEPTLPVEERTFHLPQGTGAGFICYGGSSYDPPKLTWTGPDSQTKSFTDMQGFAYAVVEGRSSDSGMYQCSGNNSVGNINGSVSLRYIGKHHAALYTPGTQVTVLCQQRERLIWREARMF